MVPSLRKRVWYQRFLDADVPVAESRRHLAQKRVCTDLKSSGKSAITRKRRHQSKKRIRCSISTSSSSSSSEGCSVGSCEDNLSVDKDAMGVADAEREQKKRVGPPIGDGGLKGQGRMLLREWLEANANHGCMSGLKWLDKALGLVQISWKHGSRSGWTRSDVEVFESWALYTGRFDPRASDSKRWKANFRCALNSLPDVVEVKEKGNARSRNPFKVYRLLPPHSSTKRPKTKRIASDRFDQPEQTTSDSVNDAVNNLAGHVDSAWEKDVSYERTVCSCSPPSLSQSCISDDDRTKQSNNESELMENYIEYNDHSYASISRHLKGESLCEDLELFGDLEFVSIIDEEIAKFSANNTYDNLWEEDSEGLSDSSHLASFDEFTCGEICI